MKKLILLVAFAFTVNALAAQTDTTRPKPEDLVMYRVAQVDFLLKKIERLQEDLNELKVHLYQISQAGWIKPTATQTMPNQTLPNKEKPKE